MLLEHYQIHIWDKLCSWNTIRYISDINYAPGALSDPYAKWIMLLEHYQIHIRDKLCSWSHIRYIYEINYAPGTLSDTCMWHDQGEWVTCRQYSILIFEYKSLVHLKCYILIQIPSQLDIWLQRYEQFVKFKNNVKQEFITSFIL